MGSEQLCLVRAVANAETSSGALVPACLDAPSSTEPLCAPPAEASTEPRVGCVERPERVEPAEPSERGERTEAAPRTDAPRIEADTPRPDLPKIPSRRALPGRKIESGGAVPEPSPPRAASCTAHLYGKGEGEG